MEIAAALLCDSATVRENLLHVLGGGINRMYRPGVPAPLNVMLATLIDVSPREIGPPHEIHVEIRDSDQLLLVEVMGAFSIPEDDRREHLEHAISPAVFDFRHAGTASFGKHSLKLSIDAGAVTQHIEFWVLHSDEMILPSPGPLGGPTT